MTIIIATIIKIHSNNTNKEAA